jgi:homopolymeric O-antigen transport system permease protein
MSSFELVVKPHRGWQAINFRESYLYRELLGFLVWRDIKIRYRQTALGGLWAVFQPLLGMIIFTLVFNRLAGVRSGDVPYPLFAYCGLAPWTFFSNSVSYSSNSLVGNQHLVSKVYFPRIFIPLGAIGAFLVDLLFSMSLVFVLILYYHWSLSLRVFLLPAFVIGIILSASGMGLALSALNVSFRDVKYAVPFLVQMGLFVTPVIYPGNYVPHRWRFLLALNPMAGMVTGFRYCLLGSPVSWGPVGISFAISAFVFVMGLLIFRRMERRFADII